jgi:hypothetical protein
MVNSLENPACFYYYDENSPSKQKLIDKSTLPVSYFGNSSRNWMTQEIFEVYFNFFLKIFSLSRYYCYYYLYLRLGFMMSLYLEQKHIYDRFIKKKKHCF